MEINWLEQPEEHDYPAASSYLNLIYDTNKVDGIVEKLKESPIIMFKAKDIFRASGLSLLGVSNYHVKKNLKKIKKGYSISPILLVRDSSNGKVIIADGFHRLSAVELYQEDLDIPCKIY